METDLPLSQGGFGRCRGQARNWLYWRSWWPRCLPVLAHSPVTAWAPPKGRACSVIQPQFEFMNYKKAMFSAHSQKTLLKIGDSNIGCSLETKKMIQSLSLCWSVAQFLTVSVPFSLRFALLFPDVRGSEQPACLHGRGPWPAGFDPSSVVGCAEGNQLWLVVSLSVPLWLHY